jgi:hypothetical protein
MTKTHDIAQQFAIMLHAANHPSPAVRNMSKKFATNIAKMKKLYTTNNVIASNTLRKMSKK